MQQKFRHEDHNRQDNAKKPDYREDLIEGSQVKASAFHMAMFKLELEFGKRRMERAAQLIQGYHQGSFWIGNRVFLFTDRFQDFVDRNRNEIKHSFNQTYKHHKAAAVHDLKVIEETIKKASLMQDVPTLLLKSASRLKCDKIFPLDSEGGSKGPPLIKNSS